MKIRCTTNHVRFRLRKSDLLTIKKEGHLIDHIQVGDHPQFQFGIRLQGENPDLHLEERGIYVHLPHALFEEWATSQEVGIESDISNADGTRTGLLIEKDFPCKDRDDEDKSDTFWELAEQSPDTC